MSGDEGPEGAPQPREGHGWALNMIALTFIVGAVAVLGTLGVFGFFSPHANGVQPVNGTVRVNGSVPVNGVIVAPGVQHCCYTPGHVNGVVPLPAQSAPPTELAAPTPTPQSTVVFPGVVINPG